MSCQITDADRYREFAARIQTKAAAGRIPIRGTVELTANCNLRCSHCYIRPVQDEPDPLGTDDWVLILEKLAEAGCLWLGISGGEPLLRPDFGALYRAAKERGFIITLLTNGTLIDEKTADLLAEYPPFNVEVSVYGGGAETCERVTGSASAFAECTRGIARLRSRGIRTALKTIPTRQNVKDLGRISRMARELGLPFRFDGILNAHLEDSCAAIGHRLPPETLVGLEMDDPKTRELWRARRAEMERSEPEKEKLFGCGAGITAFHVTSAGLLCPCVIVRTPAFDLRSGQFMDGWNGPVKSVVEARYHPRARCYHCDLASVCNTCPGFALLEHGDPEEPVDFLCRIAETRRRFLLYDGDSEGKVN